MSAKDGNPDADALAQTITCSLRAAPDRPVLICTREHAFLQLP